MSDLQYLLYQKIPCCSLCVCAIIIQWIKEHRSEFQTNTGKSLFGKGEFEVIFVMHAMLGGYVADPHISFKLTIAHEIVCNKYGLIEIKVKKVGGSSKP